MYCFFFNDTATTEIYSLSLHDALPIFVKAAAICVRVEVAEARRDAAAHLAIERRVLAQRHLAPAVAELKEGGQLIGEDRKSTRLNSSHANISYAVFCLKKKKKKKTRLI